LNLTAGSFAFRVKIRKAPGCEEDTQALLQLAAIEPLSWMHGKHVA
jgi:hypothetical protein